MGKPSGVQAQRSWLRSYSETLVPLLVPTVLLHCGVSSYLLLYVGRRFRKFSITH